MLTTTNDYLVTEIWMKPKVENHWFIHYNTYNIRQYYIVYYCFSKFDFCGVSCVKC